MGLSETTGVAGAIRSAAAPGPEESDMSVRFSEYGDFGESKEEGVGNGQMSAGWSGK